MCFLLGWSLLETFVPSVKHLLEGRDFLFVRMMSCLMPEFWKMGVVGWIIERGLDPNWSKLSSSLGIDLK